MHSVRVKKSFHIKMSGSPSRDLDVLPEPCTVGVLPAQIPHIKPRLLVDLEESVVIGTPLFEDKRNSRLQFLSPGCGKVTSIEYGPRRTIQEIMIKLNNKDEYRNFSFGETDETLLRGIDREALVEILLEGGVWPFIRELPFRDIADPAFIPPTIWISLDSKDPFQPSSEVYLKGKEILFRFGIKVLAKLARRINVCVNADKIHIPEAYREFVSHRINGFYPADDPGVILYHTKTSSAENRCWYVNGQDVLLIAELLKTGKYPVQRIICAGGSAASERRHYQTRTGAPLSVVQNGIDEREDVSCIVGGLFTGYTVPATSFLGFYETAVNFLPNTAEYDLFGFARPGMDRLSFSKTFISSFINRTLDVDSGLHGEERACINCGTCARFCPVDILPQFAYKSVLAEEVEESLSHGLLDCVECGLCTFVCPSKIELCETFKEGRKAYYKEQM